MEELERLLPILIFLVLVLAAWIARQRHRRRGLSPRPWAIGPPPAPEPPPLSAPRPPAQPKADSRRPASPPGTPSAVAPGKGPSRSSARVELRRLLRGPRGRRAAILAHEILRHPP